MNPISRLFCTSIGRKFLMAVTGLVLVLFVIGHLVGNLQIFSHPDHLNGYAEFLQSLGPTLWVARIVLLLCAVVHIWAAVALTLENKAARGPQSYGVHRWLQASIASRYMRLSGFVVLAFLIYHVAHFTLGVVQAGSFKSHFDYTMAGDFRLFGFAVVTKGAVVHDVYSMVFLGFAQPLVSAFYILAVGLLTIHLWHGTDSMFQTFGWRSGKWSGGLRRVVMLFCILYFLGNLAIPAAILTGVAKPAHGTAAAQLLTIALPASSAGVAQR
jgi:succinate dehydrogenase / fumarate reductase, cytochrome b subunit